MSNTTTYGKTYLLLSLHHHFISEDVPDGWEFSHEEGGFWISEKDPEETIDAYHVYHRTASPEYVEVIKRPELVGDSKELLQTHAAQFNYRYPEGTMIVEINSISTATST